jgi:hypothetical protein
MPFEQTLLKATLYCDSPQRHYRHILACDHNGTYFVRIQEGVVKQAHPIEVEKTADREIRFSTPSEALSAAAEHIDAARQSGWSDYNPVFDYWDNE